ncbi:neuroglian-like [Haliotis rufescens]|uniref:neuroglian-like n=1 Tax=Haliotis rufescens TaxID=6454 RepID=UPI00201F9D0A|nr:neuroglian-like [Haliotis rufescens]
MLGGLRKADSFPIIFEPHIRSTQYIRRGQDVVLNCSAEGNQVLRYSWMVYGQRIQSNGQYGALTIKEFTLRNQSHYTCRVDDNEGYDVSPVVSLVLARLEQKWNVPVRNVTKPEMRPMSLTCNHPPFCAPPGKFNWFKIEGKTPSQVMINKRIMIDNNGTLHFAFVEEKDDGIYRCGIHNTVMDKTKLGSQVNVTVRARPDVREIINLTGGISPRVISYSATTTVVLGSEAKLECIFGGKPIPTVTWTRNGQNTKEYLKTQLNGGALTIQRVRESDGGNYTCSGINSKGKTSKSIQVNVVSGPIWKKMPTTKDVSEGQDVTFVCTARAIGPTSPMMTQWIHDKGINRRGIALSRDKSELTFHNVNGGTECIRCNVSNNIDFITKTACYKVIKSSPTLLIIVTGCSTLAIILLIMVVMFFVIYKKLKDLGTARFRLPSMSSRQRRNTGGTTTVGNTTAGKSTGYLEIQDMPSANSKYRLSDIFKQELRGVPFYQVRNHTSDDFLHDKTRTDMNESDFRPITRHNSDSCLSTRSSYIHPKHNWKTNRHMFGSFMTVDRMVNASGDNRGDEGCRNFAERSKEAQNGESRKQIKMDIAGCAHSSGTHEENTQEYKPRSDGQWNVEKRDNEARPTKGQEARTRADRLTRGKERNHEPRAVKDQREKNRFDREPHVENVGEAPVSRILQNPHFGQDATLIEKEMLRLCSDFEMCPDENSP